MWILHEEAKISLHNFRECFTFRRKNNYLRNVFYSVFLAHIFQQKEYLIPAVVLLVVVVVVVVVTVIVFTLSVSTSSKK